MLDLILNLTSYLEKEGLCYAQYDSALLIIFVTSYLKYAVDSFDYNIFRFIPKTELKDRLAKAIEEYIDFTIDADIINYRKLSDTVLCIVLYNLLDNAIEANSRVCDAEKYIRVIIKTINDMLLIKIVNSAIEPVRKGKKFMTTKSDPEKHGWGLKSVIEAVKSNYGEIYYNFKEKEFVVNIAFF